MNVEEFGLEKQLNVAIVVGAWKTAELRVVCFVEAWLRSFRKEHRFS